MKSFFLNNKVNFIFFVIAFFCLILVAGLENLSFQSVRWLHDGNESAYNQLGWHFFKNDIWRFPLGNNPNYGGEFSSSIVYTDSIPILALFFKLTKIFFTENFQYFSFWYLICFYFQLFFSFKILKKFTESTSYSFVGSLFFLISPIFIYRVDYHVGVAGQWVLIYALYLSLVDKIDKYKFSWMFLHILSSLIHFYFTGMIFAVYAILKIFTFFSEKQKFLKLVKDFAIIIIPTFITLYVIGYFEIRMADSIGLGFGDYKLNLLSIFDPVNSYHQISWSWFLPDIILSQGEEIEGFNYFGLGQILMVFFALIVFLNQKNNSNLVLIKENKEIKNFIFVSILFTLWALSNKISLGSYTILEIPLNKYIFGLLSIIKSTGRVFWIVNYFLLILSLIIIYKSFGRKNSIIAIILFFIIQLGDISAGLKDRIGQHSVKNKNFLLKDQIWDNLLSKYKIIKTTYPVSWSPFVSNFSYIMEKYKIKKTNLVVLVRMNRKLVASARYNLYDNFRKKILEKNTVYLIDGLGHLRNLKYLFKDENVGFFYRDNVWLMANNEKEIMSESDIEFFNKIEPKILEIDQMVDLYFEEKNNYYGLGWSHNFRKLGVWSEGPISTLLFSTQENYDGLKLEVFCAPYVSSKKENLEFDIYVNDVFIKKVEFKKSKNDEKIDIFIKGDLLKSKNQKIDFHFKNLVSPYETYESPDSRKLGILVKKVRINKI